MKKSIARELTLLYWRQQCALSTLLSRFGLTITEHPFFMVLLSMDGATLDDFLTVIRMERSMAQKSLRSLEQKGLLEKKPFPEDRRKFCYYATEKAKKCADELWEGLNQLEVILTSGCNKAELNAVYDTLLKIEKNITELL